MSLDKLDVLATVCSMPVDNYSCIKLLRPSRALDFWTILKCETRFFCIQMIRLKGFFFLAIALFVLGCQSDENTPIDPFRLPPFVKSFEISPTSINTDTINVGQQRLPTDTLNITVNGTAQVSDPEGISNLQEVSVGVYRPASRDLIRTAPLFDNGVSPDEIAGDGTFASLVTFKIVRSDIGDFQVEVTALNKSNVTSNSLSSFVAIERLNRPPTLSDLVAPDSASVSTSVVFLQLTVKASDPDGPSDIQKVFFNSFKPDGSPSSGNPFQMLDDGNAGGTSGDQVSGDGTYSLVVQLPPGTPKGNYRFEFQAADRSGALSNTIIHTITVR
jgi:hypothetical protein